MKGLLDRHGPRSLAYMGGSAQGGQFEATFGLTMIRALGSQYYYSSAGQEFSGTLWVQGRMFGKHYNMVIPDEHVSDMLVAGSEVGDLQVTDQVRGGTVLIPHGFGLVYDGEVYGINANRLTKNTHRDPLGTPLHRFVPCRIEAV